MTQLVKNTSYKGMYTTLSFEIRELDGDKVTSRRIYFSRKAVNRAIDDLKLKRESMQTVEL